MFRRLVVLLLLCALPVGAAQARVLGTVGRVFPIAERDALEEIEERAGQVDWKALPQRERPEAFRPATLVRLPRASGGRTFLVDMTHTLDFDVPDGRGGILYPKGFRFNPLEHVPFNQTLVVLDGDDPEQLAWLRGYEPAAEPGTLILLSGGSYREIGAALGRAVFYADRRIVERFRLAAVPSLVARKGHMMEVTEIALPTTDPVVP